MVTSVIQEQLQETVNRIVKAVHPKRIILFGSSTRNERTEHSDYDLLVIMPDGTVSIVVSNMPWMVNAAQAVGFQADVFVIAWLRPTK